MIFYCFVIGIFLNSSTVSSFQFGTTLYKSLSRNERRFVVYERRFVVNPQKGWSKRLTLKSYNSKVFSGLSILSNNRKYDNRNTQEGSSQERGDYNQVHSNKYDQNFRISPQYLPKVGDFVEYMSKNKALALGYVQQVITPIKYQVLSLNNIPFELDMVKLVRVIPGEHSMEEFLQMKACKLWLADQITADLFSIWNSFRLGDKAYIVPDNILLRNNEFRKALNFSEIFSRIDIKEHPQQDHQLHQHQHQRLMSLTDVSFALFQNISLYHQYLTEILLEGSSNIYFEENEKKLYPQLIAFGQPKLMHLEKVYH
jgi:hypothetical protein